MENKRDRTVTIAVVTGVVALLLGLCLGAAAGGLGGYFIGRGAAARPVEQLLQPQVIPPTPRVPQAQPTPRTPQAQPTPRLRELPQLPQLPDLLRGGGAVIQDVVKDTPAAGAGLQVGDVITKVDNTSIDATHRLSAVLTGYKPGDQVTLTIWRAGQTQTIKVKLGANPDDPKRAYLGVYYAEMPPQQPTPAPGQ